MNEPKSSLYHNTRRLSQEYDIIIRHVSLSADKTKEFKIALYLLNFDFVINFN
jgi:hypothetical protein